MVNRVFIIGAGASKVFGIPIAKEYLEACLNYGINSNYPKINSLLEYLNKLIPSGRQQYGNLAFEELLSIMQKDRLLTNRLMGLSMGIDAEKILIGCLCKFLWDKSNNITVGSELKKLDDIERDNWPYVDFVKCLDNEKDCIITTNYDAMLDRAVCLRWNYPRYSEYSKIYEKDQKPVALFKPLGSITWVPESIMKDFRIGGEGKNPAMEDFLSQNMEKLTDNPAIYIFKDLPPYFHNPENYPVIIPPTIGADIPDSWGDFFLELNKQMLNRLSKANEIYFIGYSFPQYYEYFRILVRKALMLNRGNYKIRVVNVDGNSLLILKKTIRDYIYNGSVEYYSEGFESWKNLFVEGKNIPYVE